MTRTLIFALAILWTLGGCTKSTPERQVTVTVTFVLTDENQVPLPNLTINLIGPIDSLTHYSGITNQQGQVVFQLPTDSTYRAVAVGVTSICSNTQRLFLEGQSNQAEIFGTFSVNTTIERTLEGIVGQYGTCQVNGRLLDCVGNPIAKGWATYRSPDGRQHAFPTSADGRFSFQTTYCQNVVVTDLAFFDPANLKSITGSVGFNTPTKNLGDLVVCAESQTFCEVETSLGPQFLDPGWVSDSSYRTFYLGNTLYGSTPFFNFGFTFQNPAQGNNLTVFADLDNGSIPCYSCNNATLPSCMPIAVNITRWDGSGGDVEGSFNGYLPATAQNTFAFDGNFSGRFKLRVK